jgi:uncharacterized RDD family membrane protein YckC
MKGGRVEPVNDPGSPLPPRPDLRDGTASEQVGAGYATFWQRVVGRLIDAVILTVPFAVLGVAVFWNDIVRLRDELGRAPTSWELLNNLGGRYVGWIVLSLAASAVYEVALLVRRGQTVGHRVMRIKVVRVEDGGLPTVDRALIRWAVPNLVAFVLPNVGGLLVLLIYLWMLWDPMRQGLHDKAARTVVIRV